MNVRQWVPVLLIVALAGIYVWKEAERSGQFAETPVAETGNDALLEALAERRQDVLVEGVGEVVFLFQDDTHGSRHQQFLLVVAPSKTVKIAHNIDLAERVPVKKGDRVRFRGELDWSQKGALVHWTHHDPAGRHPGGFLEHDGKRYE